MTTTTNAPPHHDPRRRLRRRRPRRRRRRPRRRPRRLPRQRRAAPVVDVRRRRHRRHRVPALRAGGRRRDGLERLLGRRRRGTRDVVVPRRLPLRGDGRDGARPRRDRPHRARLRRRARGPRLAPAPRRRQRRRRRHRGVPALWTAPHHQHLGARRSRRLAGPHGDQLRVARRARGRLSAPAHPPKASPRLKPGPSACERPARTARPGMGAPRSTHVPTDPLLLLWPRRR